MDFQTTAARLARRGMQRVMPRHQGSGELKYAPSTTAPRPLCLRLGAQCQAIPVQSSVGLAVGVREERFCAKAGLECQGFQLTLKANSRRLHGPPQPPIRTNRWPKCLNEGGQITDELVEPWSQVCANPPQQKCELPCVLLHCQIKSAIKQGFTTATRQNCRTLRGFHEPSNRLAECQCREQSYHMSLGPCR